MGETHGFQVEQNMLCEVTEENTVSFSSSGGKGLEGNSGVGWSAGACTPSYVTLLLGTRPHCLTRCWSCLLAHPWFSGDSCWVRRLPRSCVVAHCSLWRCFHFGGRDFGGFFPYVSLFPEQSNCKRCLWSLGEPISFILVTRN